jgi:sirohydrochlorin cobaltochelatase
MKGLVFLAHGSRREKSNREVFELVDAIRPSLACSFELVEAAFLELVPPSPQQIINKMLDRGAGSITLYPFFLNSGKHVDKDIPDIVEEFSATHPDREFVIVDHFGGAAGVQDLIIAHLFGRAGP